MPAAILEASGSKDLLLELEMDMMDFIYVPGFAAKVIQQEDKRKAPKGKGVASLEVPFTLRSAPCFHLCLSVLVHSSQPSRIHQAAGSMTLNFGRYKGCLGVQECQFRGALRHSFKEVSQKDPAYCVGMT